MDIIVALGHSGYEIDIELAENIPELDLVVGGHSHTFLYTDKSGNGLPSNDKPWGDYPTYVKNKFQNKIIPVVQAYKYSKYMGHLVLNFDAEGELLTPVDGVGVSFADPVLLDKSIPQDQGTLDAMVKWQNKLTKYSEVVGTNLIHMHRKGGEESIMGK